MNFTEESVKQLSPDDASAKAGMQLAVTAKWESAHSHEKALWGACKGSGKNPYFTQIDLTSIAFKCTCPSRKFPCKHGLGLLFLYLREPAYFQVSATLPDNVAEWLDKRAGRTEAKQQKEEKPVDDKAQQKRAAQREDKVAAGLEELALWMKDLIRTGIQNIPQNQYTLFTTIASRMVDAQMPGVAGQIRNLGEINYFKEGWEQEFMKQFSKLFFLLESYKNKDSLTEDWQQELRSRIGWNISKEVLGTLPVTENTWVILHTEKEPFEKLVSEKTWLYAPETGRFGYQLQFYAPQAAFPAQMLIAGNCIQAKTVAYPGRESRRLWIKDFIPKKEPISLSGDASSLENILDQVSALKTLNPLQDELPFLLHGISLQNYGRRWYIADTAKKGIPATQQEKILWKLWSLTRGRPFDAFGTYANGSFRLLGLQYEGRYYTL
jgi:hypothetical protein